MKPTTLGLAAALLTLASSAFAQQADRYAGQWNCQIANQSVTNNRFENYIFEFLLALYPNGSFEARGNYTAETNGYSDPFQAQGRWQVAGDGITGTGRAYKQSGGLPFSFGFRYHGANSMSYRTESPYGRLAMACQR